MDIDGQRQQMIEANQDIHCFLSILSMVVLKILLNPPQIGIYQETVFGLPDAGLEG